MPCSLRWCRLPRSPAFWKGRKRGWAIRTFLEPSFLHCLGSPDTRPSSIGLLRRVNAKNFSEKTIFLPTERKRCVTGSAAPPSQ